MSLLIRSLLLFCICIPSLVSSGCSTPTKSVAQSSGSVVSSNDFAAFEQVWSHLSEHHFDTNFNGLDWPAVGREYRAKIQQASSTMAARQITQQMLDLLEVSHLAIIPGDGSEPFVDEEPMPDSPQQLEPADEDSSGSLGFDVRLIQGRPVVTRVEKKGPAAAAGIKPGWILNEIGSQKIQMPKEAAVDDALDTGRRSFLAWRSISRRLSGSPGSDVRLQFSNAGGQSVDMTLTRGVAPGTPIQFGNLPVLYANLVSERVSTPSAKNIILIRFNIWLLPTALEFNRTIEQHRDADAIIIDLRGNVGGMVGMLIGTAGHFFDKPVSLGSMVMRDNRLNLFANPRIVDSKGNRVRPFDKPVAILVDDITASASEVFAGALQDLGRARIFGRRSSGQALPALFKKLANGDFLYHPVADLIPPRGIRFEGRGVVPDEKVNLTREALLRGEDPDLARALAWLTTVE